MLGKRNIGLPELAGKFELILVFGLLSIIIILKAMWNRARNNTMRQLQYLQFCRHFEDTFKIFKASNDLGSDSGIGNWKREPDNKFLKTGPEPDNGY